MVSLRDYLKPLGSAILLSENWGSESVELILNYLAEKFW